MEGRTIAAQCAVKLRELGWLPDLILCRYILVIIIKHVYEGYWDRCTILRA
jgi:hypothetical protein